MQRQLYGSGQVGAGRKRGGLSIRVLREQKIQPIQGELDGLTNTVLLNNVTRQTSINGENVGKIIDFSGKSAILNLKLAEFGKLMDPTFNAANDYRIRFDITGKVSSQNLSAQISKTIDGSVQILENIY
jgi:hypothetical protein